jgi:amino acid transporter
MPATSAPRSLRWYLIPVRVLLATFVVTLLSFAVSLFLGILGVVLAARVRGVSPNMTIAYRHVAFPIAATVAAVVLVSASFMEGRHYRQAKTLRRMEDQMHGAH